MSTPTRSTAELVQQVLQRLPQTSVAVFDRELRFQLVAGPALADSQLSHEQLEGATLAEVVPSAIGGRLAAEYGRALLGETVSLRYRASLNGRVFWLRILPLSESDGVVETGMAVTLDITELADVEQRLRETLAALDEAQRIGGLGSWSWDQDTNAVDWSSETYRILGHSGDHPATLPQLLAYLHPSDRQHMVESFVRLHHGDEGHERFELKGRIIRGSDGETRWVLLSGRRVPSGGSKIIGTIQDVTDQRRAELEANRQRDYVQSIIAAAHEGMVLTERGRVVDANPAFTVLTGYVRDDLIGLPAPHPFWNGRVSGQIASHLEIVALTGEPMEIETTVRHRSGREIPVAVTTVRAERGAEHPVTLVTTLRDISRQKQREAELRELATHDPLTGLLNRGYFRDQLEQALARNTRQQQPVSLAVLDLDHFKAINDRHGHPTGDRVLQELTNRLGQLVRKGETLARIGGEEFAWILPDCTESDAHRAAEIARKAVAGTPFPVVGTVTISIGVCQWAGRTTADQFYASADQALYCAKRRGRNRTERHGHL